ncbi:MAG: outer membrane protein assembly factor BamA [Acidobacteriota bacterium]|nr:outer membrane protein assembly factor BamA [Acidobacteriota bacterium]
MMRFATRRWKRIFALLAVLVAMGWLAGESRGNLPSFEGQEIVEVEFRNNRTLAEETLLYYLGVEVGQPLDQGQLNQNLKQLWDTRLIDDVQVEAEAQGDGVKLIVTVSERPVMRSIDYVGLKRVNRSDIEEKIGAERIQVYEGDSLRRGELRRLERAIEELYQEKGYRFADARFSLEEVSPGERRVIFTIDEGNRVRIEDIQFEGNTVFNDWRLRLAMTKTKQSSILWSPLKRDIYNPAKLQEDLEKVREVYQREGYKNVTLGEPIIEVRATRPNAATPDAQKRRMFITIPLEEGERWKFGEVTIEGNKKYSDQQLLRAFETRTGDWLRSKKLEEAVTAVEDIYKNTGFIGARIQPEVVEREERIADIIVHIDEGDQFRIGRIDFEGNTRTRDKVLRRELRVQEGYLLSLRAIQNSLLKIKQLGYFKVDEEDPVQILNVDDEKKTIDLVIKGQEADRTELQFGGGWSEFDGFFGQLSVRTQNFLGRGETLGVQYQGGRVRNYFDLSYYIPWFRDRPQNVGLRLFSREEDYTLLTGQRLQRNSDGGSLTYGRNLGLFQSISATYTRSEFSDTTIFLDADGNPVSSDLNFTSSAIRPVYVYNSVDSPFEPTRGKKLTVSVDYAGGVLGATQNFVRPQLNYTQYIPVTQGRIKTVAGLNVEAGYIAGFDDYELSRLDRFYLGGENSVRGFDFRSIWVRDENGETVVDELNIPLGGDRFFQFNLEYHFLTNSPFRFVAFLDGGNVFAEDQSLGFDGMRYSAGVEARVLVPLFGAPLRFIYAQNLDAYEDDRFDSFKFSIGASF